jgi:uncharacterized protein YgiB involved in biofilm formation
MMKRSKRAALVLMVPVTSFLLAGCREERQQAMVFTSPSECSAAALNTAAQCEDDYMAAKTLHPQVAPKYVSKEECEGDFGASQCETAPQKNHSGGSVFMPMMMGYMMGQMLNRGGAAGNLQQPVTVGAGAGSSVPTQPLYKSRDDRSTFRTAANTPVSKGIGTISVRPSQVKVPAGQVARRGGFGQQASVRSSVGG